MSYSAHRSAASGVTARCVIVTLSDTRTPATDQAGPIIRRHIESGGHVVTRAELIPNDADRLNDLVDACLSGRDIDALITTGGTGIGPRDITIDTLAPRFSRTLPAFAHLFAMLSHQQIGSGAMLSRAAAGVIDNMLAFCLPGSAAAVDLATQALIAPELSHLLTQLRRS